LWIPIVWCDFCLSSPWPLFWHSNWDATGCLRSYERSVDFHQPMCAGYGYSDSHSVSDVLPPSAPLSWEGLEILDFGAVAIRRSFS
jgi:hypothetical protein